MVKSSVGYRTPARMTRSTFWRIQIQARDIDQFLGKLGIVRQLERLGAMRLQAVCFPDSLHHRRRRPQLGRQRSRTPVRGAGRLFGRGLAENLRRQRRRGRRRSSAARGILLNARQSPLGEAASPLANRLHAGLQLQGDFLVEFSSRRQQHDLGPQHQPRRRRAAPRPPLQRSSILVRNHNCWCNSHAFILPMNHETHKTQISSQISEALH